MAVVMKITQVTDVNAFDDGYDHVREMIEQIVTEFVQTVELRAYESGRFRYVNDDTLPDVVTDIILRELHKQSKVDGVVDITESTKRRVAGLVAGFEGDWPYRYFV